MPYNIDNQFAAMNLAGVKVMTDLERETMKMERVRDVVNQFSQPWA